MYQPDRNCPICPRLAAFRESNRKEYPEFYNAPVPSFGPLDAKLLVVGLAPGLTGANQTGRPFTGDYAGIILYGALLKAGFARGVYAPEFFSKQRQSWTLGNAEKDTLELVGCRITNAVRCVPPENKPEPSETKSCNNFLAAEIASMPNLKMILSLGLVSHNAVLKALGFKAKDAKFSHGAVHNLTSRTTNREPRTTLLLNSYHTSRYNINTGRLTVAMFDEVIAKSKTLIGTYL